MQIKKFTIQLLTVSALFVACNGQVSSRDAGKDVHDDTKVLSATHNENTGLAPADAPVISLKDSDTYQFGTIKDGDKVTHEFAFKNTGKTPLVISNVQATCGCTTPEYTKTPINPGGEGIIKVIYNSSGQGAGPKHKTVTVTSNASKKLIVLNLKGEVK